jgi:hypothetical protein
MKFSLIAVSDPVKKPVAKYSDSELVPLSKGAFSPAFTNLAIDWLL